MGLRAWLTGSARTALRDSRLYLSEWQWLMDYLEEQRGLLGDLSTSSGGSITDAIDEVSSAQAQASSALKLNLRVEPVAGEAAHQIHITADGLGIEDVYVTNVDLTLDVAASGALGLSTGTEAIDEWYPVWVGYNPTTQAVTGIFDPSFTKGGLTLSGGLASFTKWRRVCVRLNNHVGDLIPATRTGDVLIYDAAFNLIHSHATTPGLMVLSAGTASTITSVDLSPLVPVSSRLARVLTFIESGGSSGNTFLYAGNTVATGTDPGRMVVAVEGGGRAAVPYDVTTDEDQQIFYRVTTDITVTVLSVLGFEDAV